MRRVLRPAGHLIVYTNLLDGPIDAAETASIHEPLGNVVANLVESDLEDTFADAGFTIKIKHVIGTEWREYLEERDQVVSGELLRLARLRRSRDRVVDRYGEEALSDRRGKPSVGSPPVPRPVRAGDLCRRRYLVPLSGPLTAEHAGQPPRVETPTRSRGPFVHRSATAYVHHNGGAGPASESGTAQFGWTV